MAEATVKRTSGPAKRYGARYGRTLREKAGALEAVYHIRQKCPYCAKFTVKRLSKGIWHCNHCNTTFTGAAYTLKKEMKAEMAEEQHG